MGRGCKYLGCVIFSKYNHDIEFCSLPFQLFPATTIQTVIQKYFTMGCVPGKEPLSEKDLEFISQNTDISREDVEEQYTNFLHRYPNGKITRSSFK